LPTMPIHRPSWSQPTRPRWIIAILALTAEGLIGLLERHLLFWRPRSQSEAAATWQACSGLSTHLRDHPDTSRRHPQCPDVPSSRSRSRHSRQAWRLAAAQAARVPAGPMPQPPFPPCRPSR
jgi:hypothetical protein